MALSPPDDWPRNPPLALVVGKGPYAMALATVFGAGFLGLEVVRKEPPTNSNGASPRLLEELRYVIFVLNGTDSAANAVQLHQAVWQWIEKLTSAGKQHDIATLFVLPGHDSGHVEGALATWLCVSVEDAVRAGLGFWQRSGSLAELSQLIVRVEPKDLVVLRARQARDDRHATIQKLSVRGHPKPAT